MNSGRRKRPLFIARGRWSPSSAGTGQHRLPAHSQPNRKLVGDLVDLVAARPPTDRPPEKHRCPSVASMTHGRRNSTRPTRPRPRTASTMRNARAHRHRSGGRPLIELEEMSDAASPVTGYLRVTSIRSAWTSASRRCRSCRTGGAGRSAMSQSRRRHPWRASLRACCAPFWS